MTEEKTPFQKLYDYDISPYIQSIPSARGSLDYLEWATAWRIAKEFDPFASFIIHWNEKEPFFKTSLGIFVYCSVTLFGATESDVYDVPEVKSSSDVTTAHQRCLVKCLGRHGLGLKLWEKKEREKLKLTPAEPKTDNSNNPYTKYERKSVSADHKIDLGSNSPISGKTYEEAYQTMDTGPRNKHLKLSLLETSLLFWKDKTLEPNSKPNNFVREAEAFLKMKAKNKNEEEQPPLQTDFPEIPF